MTRNRFQNALDVQDAVNFIAIVNTVLLPALYEVREEGLQPKDDPAVVVIMDKLNDLLERPGEQRYWDPSRVSPLDNFYRLCQERASK